MCFIVFAHQCHPDYRLVLAANRDEYHARPADQARFWEDAADMLAGKDLEQHGTWMGITRRGRLAALTNYRDPAAHMPQAPSRGALVKNFLCSAVEPLTYIDQLNTARDKYNGFNLLLLDGAAMWHYSNKTGAAFKINPGIHGLSNHLLDTPWPKVERGKEALGRIMEAAGGISVESLFELLADRRQARDSDLPQTGVGLRWERLLSSIFIADQLYGTRCSTVLLVRWDGSVYFHERSFGKDGHAAGSDRIYHFPAAFNRP
jgi:uncharacterized protein with NRDE domain